MKVLPDVVRRFEWLTALVIGIKLGAAVLAYFHPEWNGRTFSANFLNLACFQGLSICWAWFLTYFITRGKSRAAKWVFVVLCVFFLAGSVMMDLIVRRIPALSFAATLMDLPIRVYMAWLLFTPEFEKWFRKSRGLDAADPFPWVLGGLGVLFFVLLVALMMRTFMGKSAVNKSLSQMYLKQSIAAIEYYKQVHGLYPTALTDLDGTNRQYFLDDISAGYHFPPQLHPQLHQYRLFPGGKHYVLFDVGPDGVSGTADDVYPQVASYEAGHIGYLKQ
ncbi:MAG TPA: hypothetical protein VK914_05580 [bacterium]|jgi:hypothetical protein|nr:hypothetical protein [bacterium]